MATTTGDSSAGDRGRDRLPGTTSERSSGSQAVESVQEFLAALASGAPTPGGGAAAALCGALAAALVAMVGRVTAARHSSVEGEASGIVAQADELGGRLTRLVTEDMNAYRNVIEARRSGGRDFERALVRATKVPVRLATAGREVLALGEALAPLARRSALSDLAVASTLAWAALEAGAITARTNLGDVADGEFARMSESELSALLAEGQDARRRLLETIAARAGR